MNRSACTAALTALVFAAPMPAQGRLPLPEKPLVRIAVDMPARLKTEFAETRVGELLSSSDMRDVWTSLKKLVASESGGEPDVDLTPDQQHLVDLLEKVDGRATFALQLEMGADSQSEVPDGFATLALQSSDGDTLDEIHTVLTELIQEHEPTLVDVEVEGQAFLAMETDEDTGAKVFLPVRRGDAILMFVGTDLEERVGAALRAAAEAGGEVEKTSSAIEGDVDLQGVLALAKTALDERQSRSGADSDEPDAATIFSKLRLDGLRAMRLSMAPHGEHVVIDVAVTNDPQQPTILDVIRPRKAGRPSLLPLAPRNHDSWSLGCFRLDELIQIALDVAGEFKPGLDMDTIDGLFAQRLDGLSLKDDLLAHIGDEFLMLEDVKARQEADPTNPFAGADGTAVALQLKDAAAFAKTIDEILKSTGLRAARKQKDYRGIQTNEMPLLGMLPITWAYGADFVVLGLGPAGAGQARLVLDADLARRDGQEPPPFADAVQSRLELMPADWSGISVTDVVPMIDTVAMGIDAAGETQLADIVRQIGALVRGHELGEVVGTTTSSEGRLLGRTVW